MKKVFSLLVAAFVLNQSVAHADIIQWAATVTSFSSEFSSSDWSANQTLGAPDTFSYGDFATAWAPASINGNLEFITVEFDTPVFATGFSIFETLGNGAVYQVDVVDMSDALHTVWTGVDPSAPGTVVEFSIDFAQTAFLVKGLKVYTDTDHDLGNYEEIDAIQLRSVPEPFTGFAMGLGGLALFLRRQRPRSKQAWMLSKSR